MTTISAIAPIASGFPPQLVTAVRSGLISVVAWGALCQSLYPAVSSEIMLLSVATAWLVFPIGAWLGYAMPRWTQQRTWWAAAGIGLLAGTLAGILLAAGHWLSMTWPSLIKLYHAQPGSPGYDSFNASLHAGLRQQAWLAFGHLSWRIIGCVTLWAIISRRYHQWRSSQAAGVVKDQKVELIFSPRVLWPAVWVAITLAGMVVMSSAYNSASHSSLISLLMAALAQMIAGAGLTVLGPLLPWCLLPQAANTAGIATLIALPAWLAAIAPFLFISKPVRPQTVARVWCGLTTAFFFWVAVGIFSFIPHVG